MKFDYFFTITAGRTGSAWLASFIEVNLKIQSVHEPLGIDDFGVKMPDIKLMRTFNMRGNTAQVKEFYKRKLDGIAQLPSYAETNHTLAKCGLVENLAEHKIAPKTCLIVLRRDFAVQCLSYITRGDFRNITIDWQWYLHQGYKNNIVGYAPFEKFGLIGKALWYCYEMDARQIYYEKVYSDRLQLLQVSLENITTLEGAREILNRFGHNAPPILPEVRNQNHHQPNSELHAKIKSIIATLNYDGNSIVERYLENQKQLSLGNA
jgi:hypothetical protein